jgi:hypothetical protein
MSNHQAHIRSGKLPTPVKQALLHLSSEHPSSQMSGAMSLWLEPSMKAAERIGMTWDEYAQWIRLGLWNLDGDPQTAEMVIGFRNLFGENGWKVAQAGVTLAEATRRVYEDGAEAVVEAAEVMTALTNRKNLLYQTHLVMSRSTSTNK